MEENYRFEKEYTVQRDEFIEGYDSFLKKFVYRKNYVYTAIFAVLAVVFIAAAVEDPSQYLAYLLIAVCVALAVRYWYNPRKMRNSIVDAYQALEGVVYKIGIGSGFIDISTVSFPDKEDGDEGEPDSEKEESGDNDAEDTEEAEQLPERSRIDTDGSFSVMETEKCFLLMQGNEKFYILPKNSLTDEESGIIRSL